MPKEYGKPILKLNTDIKQPTFSEVLERLQSYILKIDDLVDALASGNISPTVAVHIAELGYMLFGISVDDIKANSENYIKWLSDLQSTCKSIKDSKSIAGNE